MDGVLAGVMVSYDFVSRLRLVYMEMFGLLKVEHCILRLMG